MTGERGGGTGLAATAAVVVDDGGGTGGGNKADRGRSDGVQLLPSPALFLLPMGAVKVELGRTRA